MVLKLANFYISRFKVEPTTDDFVVLVLIDICLNPMDLSHGVRDEIGALCAERNSGIRTMPGATCKPCGAFIPSCSWFRRVERR